MVGLLGGEGGGGAFHCFMERSCTGISLTVYSLELLGVSQPLSLIFGRTMEFGSGTATKAKLNFVEHGKTGLPPAVFH